MMRSAASRAFNLEEEPASLRDRYGRNHFGQSCLLAPDYPAFAGGYCAQFGCDAASGSGCPPEDS